MPSRFFFALLCENIVSHDRKDVVDDLTAVIHVVHPLNTLALDERHQTNMLLALSTVAAQDDKAVSRCDKVWKSNHKGFWRDAAHGELLGSTLGGWNTFDPQGVSLDKDPWKERL